MFDEGELGSGGNGKELEGSETVLAVTKTGQCQHTFFM